MYFRGRNYLVSLLFMLIILILMMITIIMDNINSARITFSPPQIMEIKNRITDRRLSNINNQYRANNINQKESNPIIGSFKSTFGFSNVVNGFKDKKSINQTIYNKYGEDLFGKYGLFNRIEEIISNPQSYENEAPQVIVLCVQVGIKTNIAQKQTVPEFLPGYRSPCYLHKQPRVRFKAKQHQNETYSKQEIKVTCLPSFYVIGFPKCASTDIYNRLTQHKYIHGGKMKENYFMHRACGSHRFNDLASYALNYKNSSKLAETWTTIDDNGRIYHPLAIGDFTPTNSLQMPFLVSHGVHAGHCIRDISPKTKIIVTLRNPITRTISGFKHIHKHIKTWKFNNETFHSSVVKNIDWWNKCIEITRNISSQKYACQVYTAYDMEVIYSLFYYPLNEWLKVLPRENFIFLKFEEYIKDPEGYLNKFVLPFLDLPEFSTTEITQLQNKYEIQSPNSETSILHKTQTILENFFRPYNKLLAGLLKDDRFLWDDH